jgi:ATP adenylyltransferase
MDALWAPWRLSYLTAARPQTAERPCFVCAGLADSDDRRHWIVERTARSAVILNRFPYNNGHLLIVPRLHKSTLEELDSEELVDLMETLRRMVKALDELMSPGGYNVGLNLGEAAGAGLPGHLHWHLVPRWPGDTNFMPVLADTKVIAQSLDALYDLLKSWLTRNTA